MYEYVYVRMNIDIMNIDWYVWTVWILVCMCRNWLLAAIMVQISTIVDWLILFFVFTTADELAIAWISNESDQQEPWSGCRQHYDLAVGNMPPFEMWHRSTLAGL